MLTLVQHRTDNLAHTALEELCKMYYYLGKSALARSYPDIFADSIPRGAVAFAATVVSGIIFPTHVLNSFSWLRPLMNTKWVSGGRKNFMLILTVQFIKVY
jgi:hypothetical protein